MSILIIHKIYYFVKEKNNFLENNFQNSIYIYIYIYVYPLKNIKIQNRCNVLKRIKM